MNRRAEISALSPTMAEYRLPDRSLLAGVILCLLVCGGLLVYGSRRGIDLTDEIFYLIWARNPDAYELIYQPFGYLLNPLFRLVGGDIQAFRLAGFAIAIGAGAFLGFSLAPAPRARALCSVYGSAAALTMFYPWIITPSYNSAANVGALLAIAGMLNIGFDRPARKTAVGAVASATGLCLAAFAKPPLFAIAIAAMLVLAVVGRRRRGMLALAAAVALAGTLMSLFLAPTAVPALVRRMAMTQRALALPNTPLALPGKIAGDWSLVPSALTGAAIAAILSLALWRSRWSAWPGYMAIALSLYYVASIAADAIDGGLPDFLGLALVILTAGYVGVLGARRQIDLLAIGLLLAAPMAVALGTFNNQWAQLNFSMCFPFLALLSLAMADPVRWRSAAAYVAAIAGPMAIMVLAASYPYSLPASVFDQQIPVRHPITRGTVLVDTETAEFVRSARGLAPRALMIDLSGTGPGVGASLGARAPVLAWLNPATATWPDVVWSRLRADERERAWFVGPVLPLFEPSQPARWFAAHQASFCRTVLSPMTFWGEQRKLEIWRPCRAITGGARKADRDRSRQ